MNDLKIFENREFGEIRTAKINDAPMFCLTDVCKALDLKQPSKVKERLDEKGVNSIPALTNGGTQNLLYISESNLYKTIFQSRKESAERFTDWVTSEVLPQIRTTGAYQKPMSQQEMMRVQLGMIDGHEERISHLENNMTIDYGQQQDLKMAVNKRVLEVLGGKNAPAYQKLSRKLFSECNHDIQDYFNVNTRNNVPVVRFEEAMQYVETWNPSNNTIIAVRDCNSGLSGERYAV